MDGQNFQNNQNNQNSNQGYQDYTANMQNQAPPMSQPPTPENKTNVLAIVGMILGIISIIASCCYVWVGIIFGVAGLVCSIMSRKQSKSGMGMAGIICSIIGIVIGVAMTILAAIGLAALGGMEGMEDILSQYGYY